MVGSGGGAGIIGGAVLELVAAAAAAAIFKSSTGESLLLLNFGLSSPPCVVTGELYTGAHNGHNQYVMPGKVGNTVMPPSSVSRHFWWKP